MPFMIDDICSDINFKKSDSFFGGMIMVLVGTGSLVIDADIDPIFSFPSVIETKLPLSNRNN
jgi:hypothetical protein